MFRFMLVICCSLLALSGCGDSSSSNSLPANSTSQTVSAENGGVLALSDGTTLAVPAGALSKNTTVTMTTVENGEGLKQVILEPDGLEFRKPATLRFAVDETSDDVPEVRLLSALSGGGGDEYEAHQFDDLQITYTNDGFAQVEIDHFSIASILYAKKMYMVFALPSQHLKMGDIEYNLSGRNDWGTGHVRMYLGLTDPSVKDTYEINYTSTEKKKIKAFIDSTVDGAPQSDTFIHSWSKPRWTDWTFPGVTVGHKTGYRTLYSSDDENLYLGAKRRKDITWPERKSVAKFAIDKEGQNYNFIGNIDLFGYSCVGLVEEAYEDAGKNIVWGNYVGIGVNAITPATQFHNSNLEYIDSITVLEGESIGNIPIYGLLRQFSYLQTAEPYKVVSIPADGVSGLPSWASFNNGVLSGTAQAKGDGSPWSIKFETSGTYAGVKKEISRVLKINVSPNTTSPFTDDFSGDLSSWTDMTGDWTTQGGELRGTYSLSCGSTTCPHSDLVLKDQYQLADNWKASIDFTRTVDFQNVDHFQAIGDFSIWSSANEKLHIYVGSAGWNYWGGPQTDIFVKVVSWNGSWSTVVNNTVPYSWDPDLWHTASLEKSGKTYKLYMDGNLVLTHVDNVLNGAGKIGLHTYGTKRLDNFRLESISSF